MDREFGNVYDDDRRAESYARLGFPGTYYLAFRDLPSVFEEHVRGKRALDFGCGTGRSTRFLRRQGFDVVGVDIAANMIDRARELDSAGDYRLLEEGDFGDLEGGAYDLVLSAFTFDNIPTLEKKVSALAALQALMKSEGRIVSAGVPGTPTSSRRQFRGHQPHLGGSSEDTILISLRESVASRRVPWLPRKPSRDYS